MDDASRGYQRLWRRRLPPDQRSSDIELNTAVSPEITRETILLRLNYGFECEAVNVTHPDNYSAL